MLCCVFLCFNEHSRIDKNFLELQTRFSWKFDPLCVTYEDVQNILHYTLSSPHLPLWLHVLHYLRTVATPKRWRTCAIWTPSREPPRSWTLSSTREGCGRTSGIRSYRTPSYRCISENSSVHEIFIQVRFLEKIWGKSKLQAGKCRVCTKFHII